VTPAVAGDMTKCQESPNPPRARRRRSGPSSHKELRPPYQHMCLASSRPSNKKMMILFHSSHHPLLIGESFIPRHDFRLTGLLGCAICITAPLKLHQDCY
jgi:hypothetical protein